MTSFIVIYIGLGLMTLAYFVQELIEQNITGDMIIEEFEDEETKEFLYKHPNVYKLLMLGVMICIAIFWPIALWAAAKHKNDEK